MQIPGQTKFEIGKAKEAEWAECARRYFGYSGSYHISEEAGKVVLKHEFRISYRPDLAGDVQVRGWRFEEDGKLLILGGEEPTMIKVLFLSDDGTPSTNNLKGELRTPELRWRRLENNAHAD
jgi:hypothetical protein